MPLNHFEIFSNYRTNLSTILLDTIGKLSNETWSTTNYVVKKRKSKAGPAAGKELRASYPWQEISSYIPHNVTERIDSPCRCGNFSDSRVQREACTNFSRRMSSISTEWAAMILFFFFFFFQMKDWAKITWRN